MVRCVGFVCGRDEEMGVCVSECVCVCVCALNTEG